MLDSIHILRPYFLMLLIPAALILGLYWRYQSTQGIWRKVCDAHLLPYIQVMNISKNYNVRYYLLSGICALIIIAISGISVKGTSHGFESLKAISLVVDLTENMNVQDLKPDRMTLAKYKLRDLLKKLQDGQVGLSVFANDAYAISPLTSDTNTLDNFINELATDIMPTQGVSIQRGLTEGANLLRQAGQSSGTIILITSSSPSASSFEVANKLADSGIKLIILGVGTTDGGPLLSSSGFVKDMIGNLVMAKLDVTGLKKLAELSGGFYQTITSNDTDIANIVANIVSQNSTRKNESELAVWQDLGWYLIPLILLLCLGLFLTGFVSDETIKQ